MVLFVYSKWSGVPLVSLIPYMEPCPSLGLKREQLSDQIRSLQTALLLGQELCRCDLLQTRHSAGNERTEQTYRVSKPQAQCRLKSVRSLLLLER